MKKLMKNSQPTHYEQNMGISWFVQQDQNWNGFHTLEEALVYFLGAKS